MFTSLSLAPANRSLGFHLEILSHTHRKRTSTTVPPWRETTSIGTAIIGTDPGVGAGLSPRFTPRREKGLLDGREHPKASMLSELSNSC
jgi:hypothetical protein